MIQSRLSVALLACAIALPSAFAADTQWTGAVDGSWATAGNWNAGVPTSGDNVFLPSPLASNPTITLPAAATANQLTANASTYTLTGGTLTLSDNLYVDSASATLAISGGARVSSPNATIGISAANAGNTLSLASRLSVPGTLNVGYDGTGNALNVLAGGSAGFGGVWIGGVATSASNAVTVAANGTLATTTSLLVGYGGDANQITVSGLVTSPQTFLGYDAGADGNVATVAAGGRWTNAGPLTVGLASSDNSFRVTSGTLTVTGNANDVIVGDSAAASGNSLVVTGGTFSSQAALVIGKSGTGNSFSATSGAKVSNANVRFGLNAGSVGNTGTVSGAGTQWTITNKLRVGSDGNDNTLAITDGGVVAHAGTPSDVRDVLQLTALGHEHLHHRRRLHRAVEIGRHVAVNHGCLGTLLHDDERAAKYAAGGSRCGEHRLDRKCEVHAARHVHECARVPVCGVQRTGAIVEPGQRVQAGTHERLVVDERLPQLGHDDAIGKVDDLRGSRYAVGEGQTC